MNRKQITTLAALAAGCAAIGLFNGLVHADMGHVSKKYAHNEYHSEPCVRYEMRSYGGDAGLRFMHNIGNYTLVKSGIVRGKLCHVGPTTVEISRRHPHTKVVLLIGGDRYVFRPHEPSHQYINHWHRKYVKLHPQGYGKPRKHDHKYGHGEKHGHNHDYGHWSGHSHRYGYTHGHPRRRAHHHHRHWW